MELFILFVVAIYLLFLLGYMILLQTALSRCAPQNRTMSPGSVWLQLIPVFGLFWQFYVISNIAQSQKNELNERQMSNYYPDSAKTIGIIMCILVFIDLTIIFAILSLIVQFILFCIYCSKISNISTAILQDSKKKKSTEAAQISQNYNSRVSEMQSQQQVNVSASSPIVENIPVEADVLQKPAIENTNTVTQESMIINTEKTVRDNPASVVSDSNAQNIVIKDAKQQEANVRIIDIE